MKYVISIDPGLSGAISIFEDGILDDVIDMPVITETLSEAVYKFKHTNPNKVYKSGKKKGERPLVKKKNAKYKRHLDINSIKRLFEDYYSDAVIVIEMQQLRMMSKAAITTLVNYGRLRGVAETTSSEVVLVPANKWKKKLNLNKNKKETDTEYKKRSIKLAKKLFDGWDFKTHDQAESALIGYYYFNYLHR